MQIVVDKIKQVYSKNTPLEYVALKDVSVTIEQGEYVGIIGPTGSGKTTFVEHLNGLSIPEEGQITWTFNNRSRLSKKQAKKYGIKNYDKNSDYTYKMETSLKKNWRNKVKNSKLIRHKVGVVFQFAEYQLFDETILKDASFGAKTFGLKKEEAEEKAKKYLKMVGMDESFYEKSPFELSGGQKRRVALAGILAMEPDFLILDEPTAGLDPAGVIEILNIFDRLHERGKTIIIITHDLDNILEHTTRVLMFEKSKLIYDGDTYDLLKNTKFLYEHNMQPPKILDFISKLEDRGIKVPRVTNEKELTEFLSEYMKNKKGGK